MVQAFSVALSPPQRLYHRNRSEKSEMGRKTGGNGEKLGGATGSQTMKIESAQINSVRKAALTMDV